MSACIGFSGNNFCNEAISWSADNRLALASGDGIKILTVKCRANDERPELSFHQSFILITSDVWDISQCTKEQTTEILSKCSRDEYTAVVLDRVMNPNSPRSFPVMGYCAARWSPQGGDDVNRCILAALSHDYRLCLFTQEQSLLHWTKICDLSEMGRALAVPDMPKWSEYRKLTDWCHQQAAVGICWWPKLYVDETGTSHALLAVTMMTGLVVVWKVGMPCTDGSQCSIVMKLQPHHSYPTTVAWSKSGLLAIGYVDGQVHCVQVSGDKTDADPPISRIIYGEADLLRVSCLCFSSCKKRSGEILLVNKEDCILAYQLTSAGEVLLDTHQFAENTLHGTGMCEAGDWMLMSSADGLIQKIDIDTGPTGLSLSSSKLAMQLQERDSWICSGVTVSPSAVFVAYSVRPSCSFDHLEERYPIQVHVRPLHNLVQDCMAQWQADINSRLTDDTALRDLPDVMEVFRQAYCRGDTSWLDNGILATRSLKSLQLKRITDMLTSCMTKQQAKNVKTEPGINSSTMSRPADTMSIVSQTEHILILYIQTTVQALIEAGLPSLSERETTIIQGMVNFISAEHQLPCDIINSTKATVLDSVSHILEKYTVQQPQCCICSTALTVERLQSRCKNGHAFGLCCKTLLPCDDIDYRTCVVCSAQALPASTLKDISWLPDLHHCTLCGGLLL